MSEPYVGCDECKRPQADRIHDMSKSVAETGEAQHVFIPGAIQGAQPAGETPAGR